MLNIPKVSIVIPMYNQGKYLKQAIDTILAQTFTDYELILVNDGSTDNTEEISLSFSDKRIRYFKKPNGGFGGPGDALNFGFKQARGKYETWTSSDNYYYPTALEEMVKLLDIKPEVDYVYTNCDYGIVASDGLTELNKLNIKQVYPYGQEWNKENIYKGIYNLGFVFMWKKRIRLLVGGTFALDPYEDFEMVCRLALVNCNFYFLDKNLGYYRQHEENATKTTLPEKSTRIIQQIKDKVNLALKEGRNYF